MALWCDSTNFTTLPDPDLIHSFAQCSRAVALFMNSSCLTALNKGGFRDSDLPDSDSDQPDSDSDLPDSDSDQPDRDSDLPDSDSDQPDRDSDQPELLFGKC